MFAGRHVRIGAEDDRRTLSAYVEKLLVEHLRKLGYLKAAKK
jgi:hypothetical protein